MADQMMAVTRRGLIGGAIGTALVAGTGMAGAQRQPQGERLIFADRFRPIPGWRRHGVIMRQDLPWESSLLQDPCLVYGTGDGPLFKMWYGSLTNIGYATSEDGLSWTKRREPVVRQTLPTETKALNQPSVVFADGVWHMTYFGIDDSGHGQIHYASATRPEGPWTKRGVAMTSSAPWEDRFIYNSSLLYDAAEQVWKMWYTAGKIASAGGEPRYICYATADHPAGPWRKFAGNPVLGPMDDGGWASLGIGGPNVRKLGPHRYELRVIGWQADYPSRGGRLVSEDGTSWRLERGAMDLDLGVVGGPEDSMIYRQFIVAHGKRQFCFYNVKNYRPGWNETIDLAIWDDAVETIDPSLWAMTQGSAIPTGASFEVRGGAARSLGNAGKNPQTLQGNRMIDAADYQVAVTMTPASGAAADRENIMMLRATDRDNYYYAGIGAGGARYAIGVVEKGRDRTLATAGRSDEVAGGRPQRLTFRAQGRRLTLLDDGQEVLSVTDPSLAPPRSYIGLQTSQGTGRAAFADLEVSHAG